MTRESKFSLAMVRRRVASVTVQDVRKVYATLGRIQEKIVASAPLRRYVEDAAMLGSLIRSYWSGRYRQIPRWALSSVVFALLYVWTPVDAVSDLIPGVGLLDDAAVLSLCLILVEQELQAYRQWKDRQPPG